MLMTKHVLLLAAIAAVTCRSEVNAFAPSSSSSIARPSAFSTQITTAFPFHRSATKSLTQANLFGLLEKEEAGVNGNIAEIIPVDESSEGDWVDESKKVELILLGIWGVAISAFILINNFYGPWPLAMKQVPERVFFLSHMIGGMLFGGGIILTTCIERAVAKSNNPQVLQFWFDKVPELDGLIVVPALTVSMISGTGLSIVRYGGLNIAPPHVDAIFWTLIAFMTWWATTDLTTQGAALKSVERSFSQYENGELGEEGYQTPKVVLDRHVSNVVSCFFILILYSIMVLKPGVLYPWPWNL
mmetsp:Transcript_25147/g.52995  ORF Transcript_25147/g.52995 Transcript_25147/m.52995 type:complete len:301 (+) Transcript_25147:301-1203(+)|eukprot:CAMPEP_0171353360 /NCGR_PEP_ID=MMETSP0878-20121228/43914_1 /TAXON_ID=67004 /ORGANISM="Thalassiosira weissflogii, Strain CCMP1336" /LENGTH=300 /DNA_ID=CAMNT_0011859269 /DNA_START=271 /DNA_END=1173 /DNA_ORIENTATION=+